MRSRCHNGIIHIRDLLGIVTVRGNRERTRRGCNSQSRSDSGWKREKGEGREEVWVLDCNAVLKAFCKAVRESLSQRCHQRSPTALAWSRLWEAWPWHQHSDGFQSATAGTISHLWSLKWIWEVHFHGHHRSFVTLHRKILIYTWKNVYNFMGFMDLFKSIRWTTWIVKNTHLQNVLLISFNKRLLWAFIWKISNTSSKDTLTFLRMYYSLFVKKRGAYILLIKGTVLNTL